MFASSVVSQVAPAIDGPIVDSMKINREGFEITIHDDSHVAVGRKITYNFIIISYEKSSFGHELSNGVVFDVRPGSVFVIQGSLDGSHNHLTLDINGVRIKSTEYFPNVPSTGQIGIRISAEEEKDLNSETSATERIAFRATLTSTACSTCATPDPSGSSSEVLLSSLEDGQVVPLGSRVVFEGFSNPNSGFEWDVSLRQSPSEVESSVVLQDLVSEFIPIGEVNPRLKDLDYLPPRPEQPLVNPSTPFLNPSTPHRGSSSGSPLRGATRSSLSSEDGHAVDIGEPLEAPLSAPLTGGSAEEVGGTQRIEWLAAGEGVAHLVLTYRRRWEQGVIKKMIKKRVVVERLD